MSTILMTIHDAETNKLKIFQLQGKPATGVINQIKTYGIDHIHNEMLIKDMGIYVHKIEE